jgi:uncharacterized protein
MPRVPADPVDVDRLAAEGATVVRDWPASAFARLGDRLADGEGEVEARLRFYRHDGRPSLEGRIRARLKLRCERCLRAFEWPLATDVKLLFVADEAEEPQGEYEPALAPEGRAALKDIVEDELLLALPLVPVHPEQAGCREARETNAKSQAPGEVPGESATVQRPFANLRDWLKK